MHGTYAAGLFQELLKHPSRFIYSWSIEVTSLSWYRLLHWLIVLHFSLLLLLFLTHACFFPSHTPSNVFEYNAWVVWTTFMILVWQFCSVFVFWQPVITLYFHCIEKSSMNFKTSHFVLHGRKKTHRFKQRFFAWSFPWNRVYWSA